MDSDGRSHEYTRRNYCSDACFPEFAVCIYDNIYFIIFLPFYIFLLLYFLR